MFKRGLALCMAFGLFTTVQAQTVNINLVKTPDLATYTPGDVVTVDVFVSQDSGSSQLLRMVQLDLNDSSADILSATAFPSIGGEPVGFWDFTSLAGCPGLCGVNQHVEAIPGGLRPNIGSTTYLGSLANAAEQILLDDVTDLRIGRLTVTVPAAGGTLDVVGSGDAPDAGAMVIWGFDVDPGDPEFRATSADITGGSTTFTTVPDCTNIGVASSFPANASTLWRATKNRIRITFDDACPVVAAGDIEIVEMLAGGDFGSDVSGTFGVTQTGAEVVLQDSASGLTNKKWYRVRDTGVNPSISVDLCFLVQAGDVTGDKFTNFTDLSAANVNIPTLPFNIDDSNRRSDLDGNNFVNFTDLSVANGFIPGIIVGVPAGHTCP